jgi:hypothetical protein
MPKSTASIGEIMDYIFLTTAATWAGNANFYLSLHTSDPGVAGTQTTNEVTTDAYASYARVAVARSASGWDTVSTSKKNHSLLQFPKCTGGSGATITHIAIGTADSPTAGQIIYSGALNSPLAVSNNIQPQLAAQALVTTET